MHDIRAIRENPALYDAAWARRGLSAQTPAILELDTKLRAATTAKQEAEAARNAASKLIGQAKAQKDEAKAAALMAEVAALKEKIESASAEEAALQKQRDDLLASLPNLPAADAPDGEDENGNIEVRRWYIQSNAGPPALDLTADHVTIGEALGMMDFEAAARMSGSRFVALKGQLARLERALAAFMLDLQTETHGYQEVSPPLLVKDEAAFGTGQLPKFADDLFVTKVINAEEVRAAIEETWAPAVSLIDASDAIKQESLKKLKGVIDGLKRGRFSEDRYLIPTAEVSLTNLVREQILDEAQLPIRMTADTPCFRSEAGAAGKDTRGMIRQHQFRKVELVSITTPEQSEDETTA